MLFSDSLHDSMTTYSHPVEEHEDVWYPYVHFHGFYDPVMVGSIDGTDTVPHDRAVMRCLSATYKPKFSECLGLDPKDGDHVILIVPGWRHYKIWLPTDVSGVVAVSFYPGYLSECLEVWAPRNDCGKLAATLFVGRLSPQTTSSVLIEALHSLLHRPTERQQQSKRSPESRRERRPRLRHRSRSPFDTESSVPENRILWPKVRLVRNIATGYPCGYAFAYFENPRDAECVLRNWTQRARSMAGSQYGAKPEGLDIPGGEKASSILISFFSDALFLSAEKGYSVASRKHANRGSSSGPSTRCTSPVPMSHRSFLNQPSPSHFLVGGLDVLEVVLEGGKKPDSYALVGSHDLSDVRSIFTRVDT
ncbi:hypothetical protein T265_06807 [Opisthorchis viverrini]|uniref:RRM domain-containing protein n=1 Tax=Opisthorchis viverrini TaxID=6198 RepID=A0A074ZJ89_OPIVI|nr:hypothetical protein T265_06807 [Opisthorchis viverrini]KER25837.1 hypothetical protein T265_06807 [Opisthorchis viverrini]